MVLKTGDIILEDYHHPNKFIDWILSLQDMFDKGSFNHAMIYVGEDKVMSADFDGIKIKSFKYNPDTHMVLRYDDIILEEQMFETIYRYFSMVPKSYDYVGLIQASICTIFNYFTGYKLKIFKQNLKVFCSELVYQVYLMYGIDLGDIVTPNDFLRCDELYEVHNINSF